MEATSGQGWGGFRALGIFRFWDSRVVGSWECRVFGFEGFGI